jgi:hypothetical protein
MTPTRPDAKAAPDAEPSGAACSGPAPRPALPTPDELTDSPQLAALTLLDAALEVGLRALVSAHPEIWHLDDRNADDDPPSATVALANALAIQIRASQDLIHRYGQALRAETEDEIARRTF